MVKGTFLQISRAISMRNLDFLDLVGIFLYFFFNWQRSYSLAKIHNDCSLWTFQVPSWGLRTLREYVLWKVWIYFISINFYLAHVNIEYIGSPVPEYLHFQCMEMIQMIFLREIYIFHSNISQCLIHLRLFKLFLFWFNINVSCPS